MPTFSRTALLRRFQLFFPLLAIIVALGCTLVLFNTGSTDDGKQRDAALSPRTAPIFSERNSEAFQHADDYLKDIDKAIADGVALLRGGDSKSVASQSRYFNALVNAGYAQFGSSYYDPLGSCGVAGSSARHLWHTQVRAVQGEANINGEVARARAALQRDRQACLEAGHLPLDEATAWAPDELASPSLVPTWASIGQWPESATERSSTNL